MQQTLGKLLSFPGSINTSCMHHWTVFMAFFTVKFYKKLKNIVWSFIYWIADYKVMVFSFVRQFGQMKQKACGRLHEMIVVVKYKVFLLSYVTLVITRSTRASLPEQMPDSETIFKTAWKIRLIQKVAISKMLVENKKFRAYFISVWQQQHWHLIHFWAKFKVLC